MPLERHQYNEHWWRSPGVAPITYAVVAFAQNAYYNIYVVFGGIHTPPSKFSKIKIGSILLNIRI
jgi:hypothetical protein